MIEKIIGNFIKLLIKISSKKVIILNMSYKASFRAIKFLFFRVTKKNILD